MKLTRCNRFLAGPIALFARTTNIRLDMIRVFLFVASLAIATLACSENYSRDPRLVGSWRYVENTESTTEITFRKDGTFFSKVIKDGEKYVEVDGKWLTRDGCLYYIYTKVSPPRVPSGTRDKDTILEIAKDYLVLVTAAHRTKKYVKYQQ